jgi:UDP-GlcNAc:undecaprenyl-phosphate GlcNAc-1-phosphate transferase
MSEVNWLALAFGVPLSMVGTVGIRNLAVRRGWLDRPGAARMGSRPVPRLGGLAMCTAFLITVVLVQWPLDASSLGLLAGATLLVVLVIFDDFKGLRPSIKLTFQIGAAVVAILFGLRIDVVSNPFGTGVLLLHIVVAIPFTLFWITGMINAINFLDGHDGLAGGVVAIAALVLVILSMRLGLPDVATLALALVAVILGFLPFNVYRASIIMGDAGSNFLGFAVAVLAIMGPAKIATAILVLGVPILDVAWSIGRRLLNRRNISDRDVEHLHHRLWEAGVSQPVIVLMYCLLAGFLGVIALLVERVDKIYAFTGLAGLLLILLVVLGRIPRRRQIPR